MPGVGIVGCGAVSRLHAQSFREIEKTEIKAVSDVNIHTAKKFGDDLGADFYEDYRRLLERKDIEVVSICTPSGLHEEIAVSAANSGKHVIVEKPLEVTLQRIDSMIAACNKNGVKLACIFNNRYRECNEFFKRALDSGRFGRLINVNVNIRWYREPEYYLKSDWRGTWKLDGGGALMNQGIHYIDLLQWLAGGVESVCAYTGTLLHRTIETEDTAVAIIKMKSGALGTITAGTSIYPGFAAEIQITGERGSASISDGVICTWAFKDRDEADEEARLYMAGSVDNKRASDPMAFDSTYHTKQIRQIIDSLEAGQEPEVNGEEARKSVELILAIYKSSEEGREVKI